MNDISPAPQYPENQPAKPAPVDNTHPYLTLIQSVSHELRSTFGIISGLHSLIPLAGNESEREDMFNRLHNNTEYATQLFTDLEYYCALETGQVRVESALLRPALVLQNLYKKVLPMLQRRNASLRLSGDHEMQVTSDEEKVQNILKNIIFHLTCVTHVPELEISWEKRAAIWVLNISYNGDALPEWLFLSENQLQNSGPHISLLVVWRLVSLLGGEIHGGTSNAQSRRQVSFQFPH